MENCIQYLLFSAKLHYMFVKVVFPKKLKFHRPKNLTVKFVKS